MNTHSVRWTGALAFALAGSLGLVSCRKAPEPAGPTPPAGPAEAAEAGPMKAVYRGGRPLLDIALVPPDASDPAANILVAAGSARTALRSADGGATWTPVAPPDPKGAEFFAVRFADASHGWLASRDRLLFSSDRGTTWSEAVRPDGGFYFFGPLSPAGRRCCLIQPPTYGTTVYCTDDGGAHWTGLESPLPRNDSTAIHFRGERHGWVAGGGGRFASTSDGGASWTTVDVPEAPGFLDLAMVTDAFGWARPGPGHDGRLWITRTGGADWAPVGLGIHGYWTIADVQFLDAATGYILVQKGADGSRFLETRDGGATWTTRFDVPPVLNAMALQDPERGWFAGEDGCIYRLGS